MASKDAISRVAKQIFGALPNKNVKTGNKALRQTLVGTYIAGYYPETIDKAAKLSLPEYKTPKQERRLKKLETLRQRGKGPPKKGAGKKAQKRRG
eukprot:CAMPEP_0178949710 /NCGR_PEP_ID=MMETSP0789-20121207/6220_1 /TAXON_ID=3005 /ORGANISM="Rhizosolenia setigera, Strain CCMP 1694" /LENGTH=94 /DNA_ID=CAMNT_0020630299 /DNA_START=137 /DNA_END=421 /DNA_ORIENTATION=-